jgi:diaminopimelate decarboxylase
MEYIKESNSGHLFFGGCDTIELAKEYGTPLYVMDEVMIRNNCKKYKETFQKLYPNHEVIYASKAFLNLAMVKIIEQEGLALDVVSGGELYTAIKAGFPKDKIYFHGNNKSSNEIEMALDYGVQRIIIDSLDEIDTLTNILEHKNMTASVLIRLTPGIEAHTHHYIQTGQVDSKFGLGIKDGQALIGLKKALSSERIKVMGFHCHIGSQIFDVKPYKLTADVMIGFVENVYKDLGFETQELNLGGGFGIKYTEDDPELDYETMVADKIKWVIDGFSKRGMEQPKLMVEPGRSIVGECGITLYTVGTVKEIPGVRKYVSIDGGMTDNPRPALYNAAYLGVIANKSNEPSSEKVSIAGKCCESGDMLIWDLMLPKVNIGDILAVYSTGAYNYSMASNYNRIPRPAVVLVNNGKSSVMVKRESFDDIIVNDVIPDYLK